MLPRLKTSKKSTPFPNDYIQQITQVFSEAFPELIKRAKLIVEGRIYSQEILLRVGFLENGRLIQNNFEVSIAYNKQLDVISQIYHCIDASASLMQEFLQSEGEVDFPRTWKDYDFDGITIGVQYTTENSDLEKVANQLLGEGESGLVDDNGDDEPIIESLPASETEPEPINFAKPSLFSGKNSKAKKKRSSSLH